MAKKHSNRTERIDTDEIQGDGSYIVIRRPTVGDQKKNKKTLNRVQRKVNRVQKRYERLVESDDGSGKFDEAIDNAALELDAAEDEFEYEGIKMFGIYVVDWNWEDGNGNKMPIPSDDMNAMDLLSDHELQFIVDQFKPSNEKKTS